MPGTQTASQIILRNCFKDARRGAGYIGLFATKNQVLGTSKDYC